MRKALVLITVVSLIFGACSSESKVGSEKNLRFNEKEAGRLGQVDQATAAPSPERAAVTPAPASTPAPRAATPLPAATAAAKSFEVKIIPGGQGFDPFAFAVSKGTNIKIVNATDRVATFTSEPAGAFDSGPIAPNASFTYVANTAGTFNFKDNNRPFAQGQMEVRG